MKVCKFCEKPLVRRDSDQRRVRFEARQFCDNACNTKYQQSLVQRTDESDYVPFPEMARRPWI